MANGDKKIVPAMASPKAVKTAYDPEIKEIKRKIAEIKRLAADAKITLPVGDLATSIAAPSKLGVIREANTAKLKAAEAEAAKAAAALEYAKTHKGSQQQISGLKTADYWAADKVNKLKAQDAKLEVLRGLIAELIREQEVVAGVAQPAATAVAEPTATTKQVGVSKAPTTQASGWVWTDEPVDRNGVERQELTNLLRKYYPPDAADMLAILRYLSQIPGLSGPEAEKIWDWMYGLMGREKPVDLPSRIQTLRQWIYALRMHIMITQP